MGKNLKIRLRVGIVTIFGLLLVPLTGIMIAILYHQSTQLADDSARTAMERANRDVVDSLQQTFLPIARAVDISVATGQAQAADLLSPRLWYPLFALLQATPNTYSLYYGLRQGEFLQMVKIPAGLQKFGPNGQKPPDDANYVIRLIDSSSGERADVYFYLSSWGKVVKIERAPELKYDPRQRPWFRTAQEKTEAVNSGIYVFSGTGRPGLTLSQRIDSPDDGFVGVFGADISLDSLAASLKERIIGAHGRVLIMDEEGRAIVHPDLSAIVRQGEKGLSVIKATDIDDAIITQAIALRSEGRGDRFKAAVGPQGQSYFVSFSPVPAELKRPWTILVMAEEEEFIAPFRRISAVIVGVGIAFLLLVGLGILLASRLLTNPISQLIGETENIRRLDLDGTVDVLTPVQELNNLADALGNMKSALRSFGVYVPKEVVRKIITSGTDSVVGGVRQKVTILFTDLKGFTAASEQLEPEEVLRRLSEYFNVMSAAIHHHGGTIDKYIGDAIMALWNAPTPDPQHEITACRGLLACRDANRTLNEKLEALSLPAFVTRYGLHSDMVVVGNVGSQDRMQYSALGSAVNLASRVEGLNKVFGTQLLVTEEIEGPARGHFQFRPFGPVVAAGTSLPIELFELLGENKDAQACQLASLWQPAFQAYCQQDWKAAVHGFQTYLEQHPTDAAARLFLDRSADFLRTPPPNHWDGCLYVDSK